MRYIARVLGVDPQSIPKPLQSVCYGDNLPALREWAKRALAGTPESAYVEIFEYTEVSVERVNHEQDHPQKG